MKNVNKLIILMLIFPFIAAAQVSDYALEVMAELSDTAYHGRGYYEQGDLKAARYIGAEYEKHGLQQWDHTWFQHYSLPVNTFQGDNELIIDGKTMQPGTDYVLRSYSSGIEGEYEIYVVDTTNFNEEKGIEKLDHLSSQQIPTCDIRFARKHKEFYKNLFSTKSNACILLWENPLKFYKAYSRMVVPQCIIWLTYYNLPENPKHINLDIDNHMIEKYQTQNVLGYLEGTKNPDEWVVFTAHYDHLGMFGRDVFFPGANDNASGVAMLLNLARHYKANPPEKSMAFICVSGEECGLRGSKHYVKHPVFPLENIAVVLNFDMVAGGWDSLYVQHSEAAQPDFDSLSKIARDEALFSGIKKDTLSPHSDHFPFAEKGLPAMFFSLSSKENPYYHTPADNREHVAMEKILLLFEMVTRYLD
ncbi:MAG: M28 family peptidase [Candidatus Delongbacteria bacterium]|jgi:aminopeptidase YwaD|nr:M28 family peptidase [Candidatus Delongbacteria bacterium]